MRRALALGAVAYGLTGLPLSPAEAPAAAQGAVCGTVYCSVINTAKKVYENNCTPTPENNDCAFDPLKAALKGAWEGAMTVVCPTAGAACSLLKVAANLAFPMPYSISRAGGAFGGGGYGEGWTEDDCAQEIGIDADGNLIVPSIPLTPGGPMTLQATTVYSEQVTGYNTIVADSRQAVALWYLHAVVNPGRSAVTLDNRYLHGCYRWTGSRADCASVAFWDGVTKRPRATAQITPDPGGTWSTSYNPTNCPADFGSGGGDFDFFFLRTGKQCISYAPNDAVGKMGYVYGHKSSVPWGSNLNVTLQGNPWLQCPIAKSFIAKLTEKMLEKAGTPMPVTEADVIHGDLDPPTVGDTDDSSTTDETGIPTPEGPGPTPTSSPTPTPSSGTDYTHTPVTANEPIAPDIDWWPDLPEVTLNLGTPQCPTYDLSIAEWGWSGMILDSHCTLIEANKALISTIMILVFTMIGLRTVLDA